MVWGNLLREYPIYGMRGWRNTSKRGRAGGIRMLRGDPGPCSGQNLRVWERQGVLITENIAGR